MRKKPKTEDKHPSHPAILCGPGTKRDNEATRYFKRGIHRVGPTSNPPPWTDPSANFRAAASIAVAARLHKKEKEVKADEKKARHRR